MTLDELRDTINDIDGRIAALLDARFAAVAAIARVKQAQGLPIRDAAREQEVLAAVSDKVSEDIRPYARDVYRAVFAAGRAYQRSLPPAKGGDAPGV